MIAMLSGKKTYIVLALFIAWKVAQIVTGDASIETAGDEIVAALAGMTLRAGIAKAVKS